MRLFMRRCHSAEICPWRFAWFVSLFVNVLSVNENLVVLGSRFSNFLRSWLRIAKALLTSFQGFFFFFLLHFPFLFFSDVFLFRFQERLSQFFGNPFWELLDVILNHSQVKVVCHLSHSVLILQLLHEVITTTTMLGWL